MKTISLAIGYFSPDGQRIVTGSYEPDHQAVGGDHRQGTAHPQWAQLGAQLVYILGGFFRGRPVHCHRQLRSDSQSVGGGDAGPGQSLAEEEQAGAEDLAARRGQKSKKTHP
jgi:hypothetical protein